jgi:predicted nucleic acid-binding Zn ribbon protein
MRFPKNPKPGPRRVSTGDEPVPLSESLAALSDRLGAGSARTVAAVFGNWEAIVGPAIAAHVEPQRLEGRTLFVVADHPAWVTQVRHLTPLMLERLSERCAEGEAPERIEVRVARRR